MRTHLPFDGQSEEGSIARRGHKYPWVYVIQPHADIFVWSIYSQSSRPDPVAEGAASSIGECRRDILRIELDGTLDSW